MGFPSLSSSSQYATEGADLFAMPEGEGAFAADAVIEIAEHAP